MAIAYFIPDQRKLLAANGNAAQQQQQQQQHHSSRTTQPTSNNQHSNTTDRPGDDPAGGGSNSATTIFPERAHNFRANITIPLPAHRSNRETATCWDLITQVFCSALRFYHEAQLSPAVIEISFEFSDGFADTTLSASASSSPSSSSSSSSPSSSPPPAAANTITTTTPTGTTTTTTATTNIPLTANSTTIHSAASGRSRQASSRPAMTHATEGRRRGADELAAAHERHQKGRHQQGASSTKK